MKIIFIKNQIIGIGSNPYDIFNFSELFSAYNHDSCFFFSSSLEELILLEKNSATLIAGNLTNRNAA